LEAGMTTTTKAVTYSTPEDLDDAAVAVALNALKAEMLRARLTGAPDEGRCVRAAVFAYLAAVR
jgi:hypothetical protein